MKLAVLCLMLAASGAFAADVVGKWTGNAVVKTPEGETRRMPVEFVFRSEGGKLSGVAGSAEEQRRVAMSDVRLEEDKLSFVVRDERVTLRFEGTVSGDALDGKGDGSTEDGAFSASFTMKRSQ
jgi:hypothetical protein